MRRTRYVRMDPTGNLTCLVLDRVAAEERAAVTAALMDRCEQVGYLMPPGDPRAAIRLQMMGGEFCGNAAMATAVWIAAGEALPEGHQKEILLEVSGADGPVPCSVLREAEGWSGSVRMPLPRELKWMRFSDEKLCAVRFPGMVHLIREGPELGREAAEALLRTAAERLNEPAAGLLQWRQETGEMKPLIWVRDSGTLVWETACGSGTAAIACFLSILRNRSVRVSVSQPGGTLCAETVLENGEIQEIRLSGRVRAGREETLFLPPPD